MHDLCGGLHITLRKFRRGGDADHFATVGSFYPPPGSDEVAGLAVALKIARVKYPVRGALTAAATTLTITNARRKVVNMRANRMYAPVDAIFVEYNGIDESAQEMYLWQGMHLHSAVTEKCAAYDLKNSLRYLIRSVTADTTELVRVDDKDVEQGESINIATPMVPLKLRLSYAITYDSSQSRTLRDGIRLSQLDHPRMSLRRLIVGLGRAPCGADVEVEGPHTARIGSGSRWSE